MIDNRLRIIVVSHRAVENSIELLDKKRERYDSCQSLLIEIDERVWPRRVVPRFWTVVLWLFYSLVQQLTGVFMCETRVALGQCLFGILSSLETLGIDPFIVFDKFFDNLLQDQIRDQLFDGQGFVGDRIEMTDFVQIFLDTGSTIGDTN